MSVWIKKKDRIGTLSVSGEILYEITKEYIKKMPIEFGSFEKAKYRAYGYGDRLLYFFTTTCRNEEDCINKLIEVMRETRSYNKFPFTILTKTVNGVETTLFNGFIYEKGERLCTKKIQKIKH